MATVRYNVVCEGTSEQTYIQQLQGFIEKLPSPDGVFMAPLIFNAPNRDYIANGGQIGAIKKAYLRVRKKNPRSPVVVWADFDLYHRNESGCSIAYSNKGRSMPDFHFSYHSFEDFLALHLERELLNEWYTWGARSHFNNPQASDDCASLICKLIPDYKKGTLPTCFITKERLRNLKANLSFQPQSNPHNVQNIGKFADFLVGQLELHHPEIFGQD